MESNINPTFKNKLQKVLQLNLDSEDTLLAFNDLSSFYDNNTIDSRWNLRAHLEKRCIIVNEEFLQAFSQIQKVKFSTVDMIHPLFLKYTMPTHQKYIFIFLKIFRSLVKCKKVWMNCKTRAQRWSRKLPLQNQCLEN